MKKLLLVFTVGLLAATVSAEPMKPLFVLDDAIVWKVKTDAYWVEVQKSYDLETWETILIHGEEPPYHYVGTRKYDDDHSIFYRTIPADFESQPQ